MACKTKSRLDRETKRGKRSHELCVEGIKLKRVEGLLGFWTLLDYVIISEHSVD